MAIIISALKIAGPSIKHVVHLMRSTSGQERAVALVSVTADMDSAMMVRVPELETEVSVLRILNAHQVCSAPRVPKHVHPS